MKIWAHTLVKNEEKWLWFSVTSVINHVDKVLIYDTGSTDKTLQIIEALKVNFPDKIIFRKTGVSGPADFANVRQKMLDETKSDWFLMLDGDEIWWNDGIVETIKFIQKVGFKYESIVYPTINLVGDMFHYQEAAAGGYNLVGRKGHYNLRGVNRKINGLKSMGEHGVWGWADGNGNMIQDRDIKKIKYIDIPYLHATNLRRSGDSGGDSEVLKRKKKYRYELGIPFPYDYFYPESLFKYRPPEVKSPWFGRGGYYLTRAVFESPLRFLKRRVLPRRTGY